MTRCGEFIWQIRISLSLFASGEVMGNVLAACIKLGTMRRYSHAFTNKPIEERSELIIFLLNSERATLWMYRGRRRSYILCIGLYCWFSCHVGRGRCEMGLRVRWGLTCEKSSVSGEKKKHCFLSILFGVIKATCFFQGVHVHPHPTTAYKLENKKKVRDSNYLTLSL